MKNSRPHPAGGKRERTELGTYRDKRRPGATNEPFGDERDERADDAQSNPAASAEVGAFVVHLHDATRRHYDVRLEVSGVLWSFAVPKGPSLDPKERVLAVKTEDHPIEYLEFEDVIPEGQYGAGPMIAWDRGLVRYLEGPPEEELAQGKLHVELRGMKLRGRWAFVKLQKSDKGNEWLLFKKADESADPSRSVVDDLPRSVFSGLTVDELGDREAIGDALARRAIALGATADAEVLVELSEAPAPLAEMPDGKLAEDARSLFEAELEGVRVLATRDGDVVKLRTWEAGGHPIEDLYPDIVRALRALPPSRLALDGELVVFDATGRPSRALLAQRTARLALPSARVFGIVAATPAFLVVHDVLAVGDADTRTLPVESRRALVAELLPAIGFLRAATPLEGEAGKVLAACAGLGIAHVVAKTRGSTYDAPRAWTRLATGAPASVPIAIDHAAAARSSARSRGPRISNRNKVFWPEEGYTKGDLVDYYDAIAKALLPHLKDRPTILVRYPDGIAGKSFFQWNVPVGMPPWIRTMTMHEAEDFVAIVDPPASRGGKPSVAPASRPRSLRSAAGGRHPEGAMEKKTARRGFLVDDRATLVYIANLGCIPLHVLASRAPDLTRADFFTLDFDVKQSELRHAITLARTLHDLLDAIGLSGFPKTSGQSGLHVLVALGPNQSFDAARALADLLGRLLVDRHPEIATMERIIARRGERVYVDTGQTGISRAIVAPYSVRAVPGATVSAPLAWDEVGPKLDPRRFTLKTMPKRVAERGDLFAGLLTARPDIPNAVALLTDLVQRARVRTP